MKKKINLTLEYAGKDVDDGTMSLDDIVPALEGIGSAYGKIKSLKNVTGQHTLRVTSIERGSFHILFEVREIAQAAAATLIPLATEANLKIASEAIKTIIELITLQKHIKNKPYTNTVDQGSGNIIIANSERVNIIVSPEIFSLYKSKTLSQDINKIVKPLEAGRIDKTILKTKEDHQTLEESVSIEEKQFFDVPEVVVTKTQDVWLTGIFNSLTKSTNRGFFILNNGDRVTYQLVCEMPEHLYKFFIYKGPVKIKCKAHMDENLKPALLEITEVEKLQGEIFPESEEKE